MILDKTAKVIWGKRNKKIYENLGYTFTDYGDELVVLVSELPANSTEYVTVKCDVDGCDNEEQIMYKSLKKAKHSNPDFYMCKACILKESRKLVNAEKLKNGEAYSLKSWCIDNGREDILNRWNYNLNGIGPEDVTYQSNKRYYFNCPRNIHEPELKHISTLTRPEGNGELCNACNSFGQYLLDTYDENAIEAYWGKSNTISPFEISRGSNNKVHINCLDVPYHNEYKITPHLFTNNGARCNYCRGLVVHSKDSFGQYHIDNFGDELFLEKYWDYEKNQEEGIEPFCITPYTHKFIWVICNEVDYHGSYQVRAADFTKGDRCPYCHSLKIHPYDSLGNVFEKSREAWSDKNKNTPFKYACFSQQLVYWKCENHKHPDYQRSIITSTNSIFRCPQCAIENGESILQYKVREYLAKELGYLLFHEWDCSLKCINPRTGRLLRYDNEVVGLNLFIEVMGQQHYEPISFVSGLTEEEKIKNFEDLQWRDAYKKEFVLKNNAEYLDLPYWVIDDGSYKQIINDKIAEILLKQQAVA